MRQRKRNDNKSGTPGVNWCKSAKKWRARIGVGGKRVELGTFKELPDAVDARKSGELAQFGYGTRPVAPNLDIPGVKLIVLTPKQVCLCGCRSF